MELDFAISSTDLLAVLRRFYPALAPTVCRGGKFCQNSGNWLQCGPTLESVGAPDTNSYPAAPSVSEGSGIVTISSSPDAAEIYIDGKFHGNTPATLKLPAGPHNILLKINGRPDYVRTLEILKASKLILRAIFEVSPT